MENAQELLEGPEPERSSPQIPEAPALPECSELRPHSPEKTEQIGKGPIRENHPNSYLALLRMGTEPQQGTTTNALAHSATPPILIGGIKTSDLLKLGLLPPQDKDSLFKGRSRELDAGP